jgi:outer membrane protein assembly factor BamB
MRRFLVALSLFVAAFSSLWAADWSFWRGPEDTGVSRETGLPEKWSLKDVAGNNLVFAVPYGSITSPIVQNGQVYLINKVGDGPTQQERVQAFDAETGQLIWEHKFNVWHSDIVEDRLGFTVMCGDAETGNVYAHATSGMFYCYSKEGKVLWQRSLTEEFGRVSGYGGRLASPIVDEDKVIVTMLNSSWGEQTIGMTRAVAFDKKTGKIIWWGSGNHRVKDTYYSAPVIAVIQGQRLLLTGGGDGCLHAFKVRTGERVWSYKLEDNGGAINCTPVVKGDVIWCGHGEENAGNTQGRVICINAAKLDDKGTPTLVWKHDGVKVKFASPILHEGRLYVCDDAGKLFCFDAEKGGEPIWEFAYGRNTKGSPIWADGKIYVSDLDGAFNILKPGEDDCKKLSTVKFPAKGVVPTELHGTPAIANGKIYFTTTNQLICIGKKGGKATVTKLPDAPKEAKLGEAAYIQVYPADISLHAGETTEFTAIAYDAGGRRIGEVKAEWEKAGMLPPVFPIGLSAPTTAKGPTPPTPPLIQGELSGTSGEKVKFTVAKAPNGQFGRVVAKVGKLTGYARVRVAPSVEAGAYANDFEKVPEGRTPAGWVNTMAKFAVVKMPDGNLVLRKRNDNSSPLVARANAYIGDLDMKDYDIECDVMGTKVRDKDMPDIGIGAMRYTLFLIGNDQEARLVTWDAQKRIEKKLKFEWKPGVWYRMKMTTDITPTKGVVKGKIWEKGKDEPKEWTLVIEDPIPNTEGAALIYGVANGTIDAKNPGAEIFYDNLKVTPHKK